MRGIEGQVAVRVALKPHVGNGAAKAQIGPTIDTRGFGSAIFYFMFDVNARETQEIYVDALSVGQSENSDMSGEEVIWACGTDKTIRGDASTLPQYLDPNFPSSEGQQPRILCIESLANQKRYMRATIATDLADGAGQTDFHGFCFLLDPRESLTTDEQIAESGGEAVYIPGVFS